MPSSCDQNDIMEIHTILENTVTSCIKAAAYVHSLNFSGRLLYETGLIKTGLLQSIIMQQMCDC